MKSILESLQQDTELDKYYDLNEEEEEKFLNDLLLYCNDHQEETKKLCQKTKPDFLSLHNVIFEALSKDWDKWGDYLVNEYIRIYTNSKKEEEPYTYCECLSSIQDASPTKLQVKKIINCLIKDIDSENKQIVLQSISHLMSWIDNSNYKENKSNVDKIKLNLNNSNWKIRATTAEFLSSFDQIPKEEYKLRNLDKIRAKIANKLDESIIYDIIKDLFFQKTNLITSWLTYIQFGLVIWFYGADEKNSLILLYSIALIPILEFIISSLNGKPNFSTIIKVSKDTEKELDNNDKNNDSELNVYSLINFIQILLIFKLHTNLGSEYFYSQATTILTTLLIIVTILYFFKQFKTQINNQIITYLAIILNTFVYSCILAIAIIKYFYE